jgi:hypothetical protein
MSAAMKPNETEQTQLPNSRRIYLTGSRSGVQVPFREIQQNPCTFAGNLTENPLCASTIRGPGI